MNEQKNLVTACILRIVNIGPTEAYKRLTRGEGSGALTGFSDAKREEEPGSAEDLPQSLAVSPVKAKALVNKLKTFAARNKRQGRLAKKKGDLSGQDQSFGFAAAYGHAAVMLEEFLSSVPKPESEQGGKAGEGKPSQESPEADATPSNGTASGRRNRELSQPDCE
jgi:hypothetical protein